MAYFEHVIGGARLDLTHLEPCELKFFVQRIGTDRTIDVKFSNHCLTVDFDPAIHPLAVLIMDHSRRCAYDPQGHVLSRNLPSMIAALPTASVYLTPSDRNYVYVATFAIADGVVYPMSFHLRRAKDYAPRHLSMMVASAYPAADKKQVLKGTTKISFAVLCAKVFKGERVRPQARQ